ncbi:MAG: glycosyl transferase family 2 [Bacteroidetes bacterium]|nr:glycosyl transferase family 2 [Bacteroidota bacterium]
MQKEEGVKLVSVVILGWNGKKYLEKFLPSVVNYTSRPEYEVVYADNLSSDDSIDYVAANFPTVRIIRNPSNRGFAGGYNDCLSQVKSKYYVLLNQDVEVTENWLDPLVAMAESDERIAAVQPKLLSYKEKDTFEYAGAAGGMMDWIGYAFCRGRIFDTMEKDTGQYDDSVDIFWASGASMFVRSDAYWRAGALDEAFFAHQEEIDLCWRMKNLGYRVVYQPLSTVYHVGGGSLPQGNPRKTFLNFRNNLMMLYKNLPFGEMIWKMPFRFVLDWVAAWYSLIKNKNTIDFRAIFKAHWDFIMHLIGMSVKRHAIKGKHPDLMYNKSVVWQHFVLKKKNFSDINRP